MEDQRTPRLERGPEPTSGFSLLYKLQGAGLSCRLQHSKLTDPGQQHLVPPLTAPCRVRSLSLPLWPLSSAILCAVVTRLGK